MSDIAIRVDNLSKQYRIGKRQRYKTIRESVQGLFRPPWATKSDDVADQTFWALKDVSFEVKPGEVLGIIGRNGAGKSTLLKILSRITEPTRGQVETTGRLGSLLEVGTGFHPELTGRENVFLNGAILGMRRAEIASKFDEIVAFADTEKFLDTPVKHYSSGMYMRLAFAVAANLESEILVVDEVLAVGDIAFQKRCLGKMSEVAHSGRTVLFVSHNMNAVEELCSSVLWLEKGQLKPVDSRHVRAAISDYMFGGELRGQAKWVNTEGRFKNPHFYPLEFSITDQSGMLVPQPMRNDTEAFICIRAKVEALDPALTVGFALYDERGELLFWSYQTDVDEARWPRLQPGTVTLSAPFPPRFFNEGSYRVELIGSLHNREWYFQPGVSAPSIFVTIQGGLSDSPYWMFRRDGLLAPVLEWKVGLA